MTQRLRARPTADRLVTLCTPNHGISGSILSRVAAVLVERGWAIKGPADEYIVAGSAAYDRAMAESVAIKESLPVLYEYTCPACGTELLPPILAL